MSLTEASGSIRKNLFLALRYAFVVSAMACLLGALAMAYSIINNVRQLSTTETDNFTWGLMQAENDLLKFKIALLSASGMPQAHAELVRSFDLLYSRLGIIKDGLVYEELRTRPRLKEHFENVDRFIASVTPLIDGASGGRANEAIILREAEYLGNSLKLISVAGVELKSHLSDRRRLELQTLLMEMGAFLAALATLLVVSLAVSRSYDNAARRRESALQRANQRFSAVIQGSLEPILIICDRGKILFANQSARELFGLSAREIMDGMPVATLFGDAGIVEAITGTGLEQAKYETTAVGTSGSRLSIELSISPFSEESRRELVIFARDISHQKAVENRLRDQRDVAVAKRDAITSLMTVMSHEMRTPLHGLIGNVELLRKTRLDAAQERYVQVIASSGEILVEHVNNALTAGLLDTGNYRQSRQVFKLRSLIDDVLANQMVAAKNHGNDLRSVVADNVPDVVVGDTRSLKQILFNLINNALKFTTNGDVKLVVRRGPAFPQIVFEVIDTGIGMPQDRLAEIFKDYVTLDTSYTRERIGTGIGLGIVRRLVKLLGGDLSVTSEPGVGSHFMFAIDLPEATASKRKDPVARTSRKPRPSNVLLVEDSYISRNVAREVLELMGHIVTEAEDGHKAIRLSMRKHFDVILMDISMPGLDGVSATRAIRTGEGLSAGARIAAISAHASPGDIVRFIQAGVDNVLVKPLNEAALARLFKSLGEKPRLENSTPKVRSGNDHRAKYLDRFFSEGEQSVAKIVSGLISASGLAETADEAHKLAGVAALFESEALREILVELEKVCRAGDFQGAVELGIRLIPEWRRATAMVKLTQPS